MAEEGRREGETHSFIFLHIQSSPGRISSDMWASALQRLALIKWEPRERNHGEDGTGADRPWLWGPGSNMKR